MMVERINGIDSSSRVYPLEVEWQKETDRVRSEKAAADFRKEEGDRVEISSQAAEAEKSASVRATERAEVSAEDQRLAGEQWYRYGLPQALESEQQ